MKRETALTERAELTYRYDGSFEGLLCCVFESYDRKELPQAIVTAEQQGLLFAEKIIVTDEDKARRVEASIPQKLGQEAFLFVRQAFLTCLPDKELQILLFLRLGYQRGPAVMQLLTAGPVAQLMKAVRHLERESHLFKGFIRFSIASGVLAAEIEPKNIVLPLLAEHFCQRFPAERFIIYDRVHRMALVYQPHQLRIVAVDELELPAPDEEELAYRALWQEFYRSIAIKERENPRCRMTQMPKRYWNYMTEMSATKYAAAVPKRRAAEWQLADGGRNELI